MHEQTASQTMAEMTRLLETQRRAFLKEGPPTLAQRLSRIDRLIALLVDNQRELCEAISSDYGGRAIEMSRFTDIFGPLESLKYVKKHLRRWMRSEPRSVALGMGLLGSRVEVQYQPLGVVGLMSTWNFPIALSVCPLSGMLAAGNRVMVKMSEHTPATSELFARLIASSFEAAEIAVVLGESEVSAAFSGLPFDHLLYTGNPRIGRLVMRAAAQNLTPVTLELGGKSPTILGRDADIVTAARKIAWGKTLNSGQICLSPDYVFLLNSQREAFSAAFADAVRKMFPTLRDNPDYAPIVNQAHFRRLQSYLEDARARRVPMVEINPASEDFTVAATRRIPPTLLFEPPDDSLVMQEEIFGPLLPIKTYKTPDQVIEYVNARPRPLALYYFGAEEEAAQILSHTVSGGACINDVIMHAFQEDAPLGGCGDSGMNAYRGETGFRTFSHKKTVYTASPIDVGQAIRPPYGKFMKAALSILNRK